MWGEFIFAVKHISCSPTNVLFSFTFLPIPGCLPSSGTLMLGMSFKGQRHECGVTLDVVVLVI